MSKTINHVNIGQIYNFILYILQPFKKYLYIITGIILIRIMLRCFTDIAVKFVIDYLVSFSPLSSIWLGILILNAFAVEITCRITDKLNYTYKPRIKQHVTTIITNAMLKYKYSFYQTKNPAEITGCIVNVFESVEDCIDIVLDEFIRFILLLLITSASALIVSPAISLMLLTWGVIWILVSMYAGYKMYLLTTDFSQAEIILEGNLTDMFNHMLTVQSMNNTKHEQSNIESWTEHVVQTENRLRSMQFKFWILQSIVFCTVNGLILFYTVNLYLQGLATVGDISLVFGLISGLYDNLWELAKQVRELTDCMGKLGQGLKLVNVKDIKPSIQYNTNFLSITEGSISFENIYFSYPQAVNEDTGTLFDGTLSFTIKPGEFVGLVGPSGSGKSTILKLLLRLFELEGGCIKIDQQDISQVSLDSLRSKLAVIPQDTGIFQQRSIAENIAYGSFSYIDEVAMKAIIEAAKQTQAHEFIMSLPDQYNTILQDHGINLSGGQKQRIAIARGFVRKASIFLFDEATSALDNITQSSVQERMKELIKGKTTLVIAHRLHTLQNTDRVLVFDKGHLIQEGTHDQLIKEPGLYKTMWNA